MQLPFFKFIQLMRSMFCVYTFFHPSLNGAGTAIGHSKFITHLMVIAPVEIKFFENYFLVLVQKQASKHPPFFATNFAIDKVENVRSTSIKLSAFPLSIFGNIINLTIFLDAQSIYWNIFQLNSRCCSFMIEILELIFFSNLFLSTLWSTHTAINHMCNIIHIQGNFLFLFKQKIFLAKLNFWSIFWWFFLFIYLFSHSIAF